MGEPKTPHFYDFGTRTRPRLPKPFFLYLETPIKNNSQTFKTYHFTNLKKSETQDFDIVRKDGRRQMMKIRLRTFRKSWIWGQYLPEHIKWKLGKFLEPRNQDTKRPRN